MFKVTVGAALEAELEAEVELALADPETAELVIDEEEAEDEEELAEPEEEGVTDELVTIEEGAEVDEAAALFWLTRGVEVAEGSTVEVERVSSSVIESVG